MMSFAMEKLRTRQILDYLREKKTCTLAELMKKFKVSSATIHRDVLELTRRDAVSAVRGGLVFNDAPAERRSASEYSERVVTNRAAKVTLARKAAKSGDVECRYAGNKALQYLAAFRKDADDLDACRMEMINHILKLRKMVK